jgi:3-isopropylmalate/(R)-2-methylmalate dehydratase small subunit
MDKFTTHQGIGAPLRRADVNTDDIIPARFLKSVLRTGFGQALFANWRYAVGDRVPDPAFVLNQPAYVGASVLVAGDNFGCGSSREHAPWALGEYGFRCIVAPSFADIFYNNCFNNGILPVILDGREVDELLDRLTGEVPRTVLIDLPEQAVHCDGKTYRFAIDPFRKAAMIDGLDNVAWTLSHASEIATYEQTRRAEAPWLFAAQGASDQVPRADWPTQQGANA